MIGKLNLLDKNFTDSKVELYKTGPLNPPLSCLKIELDRLRFSTDWDLVFPILIPKLFCIFKKFPSLRKKSLDVSGATLTKIGLDVIN